MVRRRNQTLYRDSTDKMLGGVCSGLGHYFDVDTVLIRVFFVALTVVGGGGLFAYLLLWIFLDQAPLGHGEADQLQDGPADGVLDAVDLTDQQTRFDTPAKSNDASESQDQDVIES